MKSYEVAIVGAGAFGLSAAATLAEAGRGISAIVVDAGSISQSALARAAGFAVPFGRSPSHSELALKAMSTFARWRRTWLQKSITDVHSYLVDDAPRVEWYITSNPSVTFKSANASDIRSSMPDLRLRPTDDFVSFEGGIRIDPMQFVHECRQYLAAAGVTTSEGTSVRSISEDRHRWFLSVRTSSNGSQLIAAKNVILALGASIAPWHSQNAAFMRQNPGRRLKAAELSEHLAVKRIAYLTSTMFKAGQPALYFPGEGMFFLPDAQHRQTLLSFTRSEWLRKGKSASTEPSETDLQEGRSQISRRSASLAAKVSDVRVGYDVYSPDGLPRVAILGDAPFGKIVAVTAGSGSGLRLAPRVAHMALETLNLLGKSTPQDWTGP